MCIERKNVVDLTAIFIFCFWYFANKMDVHTVDVSYNNKQVKEAKDYRTVCLKLINCLETFMHTSYVFSSTFSCLVKQAFHPSKTTFMCCSFSVHYFSPFFSKALLFAFGLEINVCLLTYRGTM